MEQLDTTIVRGLLYNDEYTRKVYPYLKPDFFEGTTKLIFNLYSTHFTNYNNAPTEEALVIALQKSKLDEGSYGDCIEFLEGVVKSKNTPIETDWLVNETQEYCKNRALYNAIYQSINIIEGNGKKGDQIGIIPELLDEALSVSFDTTIGSDYFNDAMSRYEWYTNAESKLRFALESLNLLSNGGLPNKTLNVILASTNVGKSALMCFTAAEWLRQGKNVLYISLEMSEEAIMERIDMNLLDMSSDDLRAADVNTFREKIEKLQSSVVGKLKVKEYPTGSANAGHFKALLKELKQKQKFIPDVIIVDYINICSSVRFSASGSNSYSYIKAIAEELRGIAVEFNVPVLSATQVNREGSSNQEPDMTNVSDSFGLAMTVDWMIALVTNDELMKMNKIVALLLKTRYGNKSNNTKQVLTVDYDRMRYTDHNESESQQIAHVRQEVSKAQHTLQDMVRDKKEINWG